jgi:hypothetical protein
VFGCRETRRVYRVNGFHGVSRPKQDIHIHCLSLDRARSRDKQWELRRQQAAPIGTGHGPDQRLCSRGSELVSVASTASASRRRRSRQAESRPKVVQFSLTEEEFDEVSAAAARSGLARGAFAAEVTLAAVRGAEARVGSPLRQALAEVMSAAGLVRRVGTNLNQAVARLNATGQRGDDLFPAAQFCIRVIRRLDEAAEQLRRSIP